MGIPGVGDGVAALVPRGRVGAGDGEGGSGDGDGDRWAVGVGVGPGRVAVGTGVGMRVAQNVPTCAASPSSLRISQQVGSVMASSSVAQFTAPSSMRT
ncbi:MAG: hypothetical protein H5T61_03710 [Thermoflexales bacterium]|nr:hypothetical protein [Thermoflexales bacterium]